MLIEDIADASIDGTCKVEVLFPALENVPLVIRTISACGAPGYGEGDRGSAGLIMRRYERTSTLFTSNCSFEDWPKLFGDAPAVAAMLDRLLLHGHVLQCGPRS